MQDLPFYYEPDFWYAAMIVFLVCVIGWTIYSAVTNKRQLRSLIAVMAPLTSECDSLREHLLKIRTDYDGVEDLAGVNQLVLRAKTIEEYSLAAVIPSSLDIAETEKLIAELTKWKAIMSHPDYVHSAHEMVQLGKMS